MNFKIIIRDGFELRLREETDAEACLKVVDKNRNRLRTWLPWLDNNTTLEDMATYLRKCRDNFATTGSPDMGIWYEGRWIGSGGFHDWDKTNRKSSIGYWISEEFQGKGLVTEAVKAFLRYGFEEMNLNKIEIHCAVDNSRSRAIPERLGMRQDGILRDDGWLYDHFVDIVIYSILKEEWEAAKK